MLYAILLGLLILTSIVLVAAILMQAGKGGGLAANFGGAGSSSDSFLGSRQATNVLTKSSWYAGAVFLGLSYILSLYSTRGDATRSIIDQQLRNPPASTQIPATGGGGGGAASSIFQTDTGKAKVDTGKATPPTTPPPAQGKSGGGTPF